MSGFVVIYREMFDHHLFRGNLERAGAWAWLIANACWKETTHDIRGRSIDVQRGQLCVSVRQLSEEWGWPKSSVARFLNRLENEGMIAKNTRSKSGTENGTESGTVIAREKLLITICKYDIYQSQKNDAPANVGQSMGQQMGQSWDTKEQGNKLTPPLPPSADDEIDPADDADSLARWEAVARGGYAFAGQTIRLNKTDFENWKSAYPSISVKAELERIDRWYSDKTDDFRKKWFTSVPRMLAKKVQEQAAKESSALDYLIADADVYRELRH